MLHSQGLCVLRSWEEIKDPQPAQLPLSTPQSQSVNAGREKKIEKNHCQAPV